MAATSNISINDNAAVAKTFIPTVQIKDGYEYRDSTSATAAPRTLRVTHVLSALSTNSNTKAGVRFTQVRLNSAGAVRTSYIDVTISAAKDGVTDADMLDLGAFVRNFLTNANLSDVIIGKY